jgi:hypothetical protein
MLQIIAPVLTSQGAPSLMLFKGGDFCLVFRACRVETPVETRSPAFHHVSLLPAIAAAQRQASAKPLRARLTISKSFTVA